MQHSAELHELAAALSAAQGQFEAVAKDATNPFFKSKYADLPAVVKGASPILAANGLAVAQLLGHDETGDTLTTVLLHSSGQYIADTMHLRPVKDDPQAQGSATTYGRRYAYMAALGLVADEDDDGNAASEGTRRPSQAKRTTVAKKPATPTQPRAASPATVGDDVLDGLRRMTKNAGWEPFTLQLHLTSIGVEDVSDLKAAMASLTLDQAVQLAELTGGSGDDLMPGSGEASRDA